MSPLSGAFKHETSGVRTNESSHKEASCLSWIRNIQSSHDDSREKYYLFPIWNIEYSHIFPQNLVLTEKEDSKRWCIMWLLRENCCHFIFRLISTSSLDEDAKMIFTANHADEMFFYLGSSIAKYDSSSTFWRSYSWRVDLGASLFIIKCWVYVIVILSMQWRDKVVRMHDIFSYYRLQ